MKSHLNINTERENTITNSNMINNLLANKNNLPKSSANTTATTTTTTACLMNDPLMSTTTNMSMETNIYFISTNTNNEITNNSNLFEEDSVRDNVRLINLNDHYDQRNQSTTSQPNFIKNNIINNNHSNSISMMDTTSAPSSVHSSNGNNINTFFNPNLIESKKG